MKYRGIVHEVVCELFSDKIQCVLLLCSSSDKCLLHALMCAVSVVTVVFIHTMEDDQRLNTLVHEGDTLYKQYDRLSTYNIIV